MLSTNPLAPLFSSVSAGAPTEVDPHVELIDFRQLFRLDRNIIVKINGDSMAPRIHSGSFCIVDPIIQPVNGDIVVAHVGDDEHVVKVFSQSPRRGLRLVSLNERYEDVLPTELSVVGVVEWIFSPVRGLYRPHDH